jgi:hypothetical protein
MVGYVQYVARNLRSASRLLVVVSSLIVKSSDK